MQLDSNDDVRRWKGVEWNSVNFLTRTVHVPAATGATAKDTLVSDVAAQFKVGRCILWVDIKKKT